MTFRVGLQFTADAKAAKAEVDALAATVRKAGAEADGLSTKGTKAKVATEGLGKAAVRADAQFAALKTEIASLKTTIDTMTAAEARAVTQMGALAAKVGQLEAALGRGGRGRGGSGAVGSAGNLIAQFNDLGVMMAAGQNPLQLAIQQGTQITQVIGPMGAGGAVKALGGAFLGMLNPINLIVIGSIAAGAAMIQWLTGANADARTFDDALADVETSISSLNESANAFSADGLQSIEDKYGAITAEVLRLLDAQRQLDQREARTNLRDTLGGLSDTLSEGLITTGEATIRSLFQTDIEQSRQLKDEILQIGSLGSFQQQAAALAGLQDRLLAVSGGISTMSDKQYEFYQQLVASEAAVRQLAATEQSFVGPATAALRDQVAAQQEITRASAERHVAAAEARREDEATAREMLAATAEQSNMQALIAQYGAESAQVAQAQAAAARAVYEASVDALDVTAARKAELMVSYDVERMMASLNIAGPLGAGADQAGRMAGNLSAALSFAQQIAMVQAATPAAAAELGFGLGAAPNGGTGVTLGFGNNRGSNFNAPPRNFGGAGAGGGGGGGGGAREERDAVAELIERLQEEAAIRAELDPVQQEMLRYREELSGATADQRLEVEALIEAEQREADAAQATQERWGYLRDTAYDALLIMAKGGDDASAALRNLGASLAEAAFQAAIMGTGPLGSLFGGTSIFGMLGSALGFGGGGGQLRPQLRPFANGGMITGPGGGKSDDILMWGSSGEFMMNARATQKHRHTLEAMNANSPLPGYADGGMIGGGRASGGGRAAVTPVIATFKIDVTGARGNAEIMDMVRSGVEQGMAHYDRSILPSSVQRISADGRRIG